MLGRKIDGGPANDLLLLKTTYEIEKWSQPPELSSDDVVHVTENICVFLGTSARKILLGSVELCIRSNGQCRIKYNCELQFLNQYLNKRCHPQERERTKFDWPHQSDGW